LSSARSNEHDARSAPESSSSSAADPVALCHTKLDARDLFTISWVGHALAPNKEGGGELEQAERREEGRWWEAGGGGK
jgi:hypothetical protein